MLPISYLNLANVPAFRSVQVRDGLVARQDRVPPSQQVDLPEIQESFRVSFSDEARLTESMATRDALASELQTQSQTPAPNQNRTSLYRQVAAL